MQSVHYSFISADCGLLRCRNGWVYMQTKDQRFIVVAVGSCGGRACHLYSMPVLRHQCLLILSAAVFTGSMGSIMSSVTNKTKYCLKLPAFYSSRCVSLRYFVLHENLQSILNSFQKIRGRPVDNTLNDVSAAILWISLCQSSCENYSRPVRCLLFILFHVHHGYHFHHLCSFIYFKKTGTITDEQKTFFGVFIWVTFFFI